MQLQALLGLAARVRTHHNLAPAAIYEHAIRSGDGRMTNSGALASESGEKTGRSPGAKRIVRHPLSEHDIWWGEVNRPLPASSFRSLRRRAADYLAAQQNLYVVDGYAGCSASHRLKVRVICKRPYHALFMHNMLVRPTRTEMAQFGDPDFTILNAGAFPADADVEGVGGETSIAINFEDREMVILGSDYAGEMKKGVFTVMQHLMPAQGVLTMHCSANEGPAGDVTLFFGLSGTGKTTLSADPQRRLIGDDEHGWAEDGVFNIEGGCYAKCIDLSRESEPQIFAAIRFGALFENVGVDGNGNVDFADVRLTQNTRVSYPVEHIPDAKISGVGAAASNIIFLTCDAFGVLPPVSRLTTQQAIQQFINGYTAKTAGVEVGVEEPQATFSPCFGAAFLPRPPVVYAELLAERIAAHRTQPWLINTGWTGGGYGVGRRIELRHTRAIIDAIHAGQLQRTATETDPVFELAIPQRVEGVPNRVLDPRLTWSDPAAYDRAAIELRRLCDEHYQQFVDLDSSAKAA